jgi:rod shape-determining protein MreB
MIEALLRPQPVYVKIYSNKLILKAIGAAGDPVTISPETPFTSERLLIGRFTAAVEAMKRGLKQVSGQRFAPFGVFARIVIQPKEKLEGGLSEVETRLFQEVAQQAGATRAVVWTGNDLSDDEAARLLAGRANSAS